METKRIAVFAGSFDPITRGHENIVLRAAGLFDHVIVAIGQNSKKSSMFSVEERKKWIQQTFASVANVSCESYEGLTVEFCKSRDAAYLLRGLRNGGDFEYERTIAQMTRTLDSEIETVLLFTDPIYAPIQSTVVREILKNGGDVSAFIPEKIVINV